MGDVEATTKLTIILKTPNIMVIVIMKKAAITMKQVTITMGQVLLQHITRVKKRRRKILVRNQKRRKKSKGKEEMTVTQIVIIQVGRPQQAVADPHHPHHQEVPK